MTVTGPALQALCWAEKPVAHFSSGGWFAGMTTGLGLKNVFLRIEQVCRADDEGFCLRLARSLVATKIRSQRTLLQSNHVKPCRFVLARLKQLAEGAAAAASMPTLLGIEGSAARLYFEQFAGTLKPEKGDELPAFDFDGRNRRPPRDPVNALLSFAYGLLSKDLTIVCHAIGFDPLVGFYHQPPLRASRAGARFDGRLSPAHCRFRSPDSRERPHGDAKGLHRGRPLRRVDAGRAEVAAARL